MQDGSTADMIFGIPELIAFISRHITLEPGDLIATGTPSGVGVFRDPPVFLEPGDRVRCEIEGIGSVENPIVDWTDDPRDADESPICDRRDWSVAGKATSDCTASQRTRGAVRRIGAPATARRRDSRDYGTLTMRALVKTTPAPASS